MIINESDLKKIIRKNKPYWTSNTRLGQIEVHEEINPDLKEKGLYYLAMITPSGKVYYYQELTLQKALNLGNNILHSLEKYEDDPDTYGDPLMANIAKQFDMLTFYY